MVKPGGCGKAPFVVMEAMRRDEVIEKLRAHADEIRGFGVTALYLYGSAARDEAGEASDIDLFADVDYDRFGFIEFMDTRQYLADLFGREVDFTTRNGLHVDLRNRIVLSAIEVFNDVSLPSVAAE